MSKPEPSKAAQRFAAEWTKQRWRHGAEAIAAGRDIATDWVRAQDLALLFDVHLQRAIAGLLDKWREMADEYGRLLHEIGIPDATIEQASYRITELRAEARRSADIIAGSRILEVELAARLQKADELAEVLGTVELWCAYDHRKRSDGKPPEPIETCADCWDCRVRKALAAYLEAK